MKFILCLILVAGAGALRSAPATSFKALRAELKLGDLVGSGASQPVHPRAPGSRSAKRQTTESAGGTQNKGIESNVIDFVNRQQGKEKCKAAATMQCEVCQHWIKAAEGLDLQVRLNDGDPPPGPTFAKVVAELEGTKVKGYACGINKEWYVFVRAGFPLVKAALNNAKSKSIKCLVDNKVSCGGLSSIPATCTAKNVTQVADKATCEAITGADVVTDAKCKAAAVNVRTKLSECKYTAAVTKHKAICKVAGCCA